MVVELLMIVLVIPLVDEVLENDELFVEFVVIVVPAVVAKRILLKLRMKNS